MLVKPTLLRVLFAAGFLLFINVLFAQRSVSGRITDAVSGQPVVGSTVTVKGSTTATQTDAEGNFTISVPNPKSRLIISSVGFQPEDVATSGLNNIAISLKTSSSSLNEVVVTGYTAQRKKDITGAVTVVDVADLKTQPNIDAQSQLQGRASGVTVTQSGVPGSGATVRIRGLGSFNNNNPLYVVDGVQTSSITGLNPNDIESMQVLKDAASAAIYGVRGSNGVIIVTTKKGRKRGVSVAYDGYYGVSDPGKGLDYLNAQEQADLLFLARTNSKLPTTGSVFGTGTTPVLPDYIFYTGAPNNGIPINNGNPGVDQSKYQLDYGRLGDPGYSPYIIVPTAKNGTDWYEVATRSSPIQNHNVTMSGANDGSRFLLSLNYFDQKAITEYQFYKRYTVRLNSEFNITKGVRVGQNLQLYSSESNVPTDNNTEASIIAQTSRITSIVPVYTSNGVDFAGTAGGSGLGTWGNGKNPLAQLARTKNNRNNNVNVFGNLYAEVDLASHFTLRSSFGGAINYNNAYTFPFIEYEHVENTANTTYTENFIKNNNWIWTNQVTYRNVFGNHSVAVLAGTESQKGGGRQEIGAAQSFYSYNYQPFINLSNGSVQNLGGSNTFTPVTTVSYFAKADYAFKDKYIVSASFRRDGSSKFLAPNQYGNFPAFSLGWRISQELFMKNISWLNDFKIRGSWGKLGNDAPVNPANAYTTFASNRQSSWYDLAGTQSKPQEGFYLAFTGNPLGTWEKNATTNIGFDATIFNGSTSIVFDWYEKKTEDLLYNPSGQAIGGAVAANNPPFRNVGSMKNTGIDILVDNKANLTAGLKLNTTLTFTTYKNTITAINGTQQFFDFNSPANEANRIGQNATRNFVGHPLNTYYGYQVLSLWQTQAEIDALTAALRAKTPGDTTSVYQTNAAPGRFKFQDVNGDGKIDASDRTIIGNPNPDFSYGINIGLEYRNFDFSAFFYGVAGKDNYSFTRWYTDFSGGFPGGRSKRSLYESWLPDGSRPDAKTPIQETAFNSGNLSTSYFVEDASYFRLRNVQIGYTLPISALSRFKVSKVRIYVQGTNLFTITKYDGFNPEVVSTDDRASSVDIGAYPTVRQYLVGANITF